LKFKQNLFKVQSNFVNNNLLSVSSLKLKFKVQIRLL